MDLAQHLVAYQPRAGDVVFLETAQVLSREVVARIEADCERLIGAGVKVVILEQGLRFARPARDAAIVGDRIEMSVELVDTLKAQPGQRSLVVRLKEVVRRDDGLVTLMCENV